MSDLSTLLADAAVAARPTTAPPYETLVRRRRRRDLRNRAVAGVGVLVLAAGAASLVPGLSGSRDRALPAISSQDWRAELLSDVKLGVQLQSGPLQAAGFGFLLTEGFTDEVATEDRTAVGALLDGPVTLTARNGDEVTCLRAIAVQGVLTWQEPTAAACADRASSALDLELDLVGPASERFEDNPLVKDGELIPPPG